MIIKKRALTLIEMAISIIVLSLVFVGVVNVFNMGFKAAAKTKQKTAACNIAREVMETYDDWSALVTLAGSPPSNGTYTTPPDPVTLNGVVYTPSVVVSDGPVSPLQLKQIDVTVTWDSDSITITTLQADY